MLTKRQRVREAGAISPHCGRGEAGSKEATNSPIQVIEFQSGSCPKYRSTSDGGMYCVLLQLWIESMKELDYAAIVHLLL